MRDEDPILTSDDIKRREREALSAFVSARIMREMDELVTAGLTKDEAAISCAQSINKFLHTLGESVMIWVKVMPNPDTPGFDEVTWGGVKATIN